MPLKLLRDFVRIDGYEVKHNFDQDADINLDGDVISFKIDTHDKIRLLVKTSEILLAELNKETPCEEYSDAIKYLKFAHMNI